MKNLPHKADRKIRVAFFQRRPRPGFSFSIEYIFNDIRLRLKDRIEATLFESRKFNDGFYSKFVNIIEAASRVNGAVIHITGEIHFINLLMPRKKVLLTIHDCGMMERKTGVARQIVKWLYLTAPVAKAKWITTNSEETKKQVIHYTGCNPAKICVIPVAINPVYQPAPKPFSQEKPVLLHIGTGPNKNLLRLIEAVQDLPCHLCIVGKLNTDQERALLDNRIEYSNHHNISDEQLLQLYQLCDIVCFVSTFEGFGMPIVEANAVERAVITSNISSMPEIAGNAACLVDPFSVPEINKGLLRLINDEAYRNNLIEKGKKNKLRYDGQLIADKYYDLYREIDCSN